jgi:LmbE family N-acetylglucosaminyl deacetylase
MPPGQMRRVVEELWERHDDPGPAIPLLGVANPDAFGIGAAPPSLVIDVSSCAQRKLAALKCHRSQIEGGAFARMTDGDAARYFAVEHFHRPPGSRVRSRHAFLDLLESVSGVT